MDRLAELIGRGAVPSTELASQLGLGENALARAVQMDGRFGVVDDSFVYTPALLDGTVWTVPIDPDQTADQPGDDTGKVPGPYVRATPYLAPMAWWLVTHPAPLLDRDGNEIDRVECSGLWLDRGDTDVIHGDERWLDGIGPWAAFHVGADGVRLESLDQPPAADPDQVTAVRSAYELVAQEREAPGFGGSQLSPRFASLTTLLLAALAHHGDTFRAASIAPVPELVAAAGLELRESLVAEAGFDWDQLRAWQNRNRLRTYYGLDDDEIDGLSMMTGACELFAEQGDDALGTTDEERVGALVLFAALLRDAGVTSAFLEETQRRGVTFHDLARFADEIAGAVDGTDLDASGVAWLRATCSEARADWAEAIRLIDDAVDEHTTHTLALIDAAYIAADRSQPARARQLLARAGVVGPDDESGLPIEAERLLDEIRPFTGRRQRSDVKRNDPCPCGSGRKYKVCHLGKETLTIDERAPWLYEKACRFARLHLAHVLDETARDLAEYAPEFHESLVELPFVMDLVLHEYKGWGEFVDGRGSLLPADELAVAEAWAGVPRAVFAVESTRGDGSGSGVGELRLRNVVTGEIVVVSGVQLDERIDDDQLFVGRPLPVGDTWRSMSGFFPLAASGADAVIEAVGAGDVNVLIDLLAQELAPG